MTIGLVNKENLAQFTVSTQGRNVQLAHVPCREIIEVWNYPVPLDTVLEHIEDHEC